MAIQWDSLHFYTNQNQVQVADLLHDHLDMMGYRLYDPFTGLVSQAYTQRVQAFLDGGREGWFRLIGAFPLDLSARLSRSGLVLHIHVSDEDANVHVFVNERPQAFSALQPHLQAGYTIAHLHQAILGGGQSAQHKPAETIPVSVLPQEVQQMAKDVNPNQMNRMFNKLMGQVSRAMGDKSASAKALLAPTVPDWSHGLGGNIRAFMDCLHIPSDWHTPDFITLRDAYMAHHRFQRNPKATRLPGDNEVMNAVPNALSYTPIYAGK
ncbi:MAG: hypothetical protein KJ043_04750 [Anaerolineae bacterium]|nr:hypothetical protein [Anaerolineae bacterium]